MEQMGCGGEVLLAEEKDYKDWGIEIRVRFRNQGGADGALKVSTLTRLMTSLVYD
jgi:hypothetical protein